MLNEMFEKTGYVILKRVLTSDQCRGLRARVLETFRELDEQVPARVVRVLAPSSGFSLPEAWGFLVHERVVTALQAILEPHYALIPDLQIQRNLYGLNRTTINGLTLPGRWGWHQDAGSEGFQLAHLEPSYRFVKCGLYLQDNDPGYGGGIDLVPGSHRFPIRTGNLYRDWQFRQLAGKLGIALSAKTIPLEQGDAVFFHSYLWHSSTLPKRWQQYVTEQDRRANVCRVPAEHTKLTVYFNACRRPYAEAFLQHSLQRARAELRSATEHAGGMELFFCDYLSFPASGRLPEAFLERVNRAGIHLASLTGRDLEEARRLRQEIIASGRLTHDVQHALIDV